MDPKLKVVIRRAVQALRASKARYAIGGAIALRAHGIIRETRDLDVFLGDESVHAIFESFRRRGFVIEPVHEPIHYWAFLPKYRRHLPYLVVDLLVSESEPESSALRSPARKRVEAWIVPVFPATELAAAKFLDPKGRDDVGRLLSAGLTSPRKVHAALEEVTAGDAKEFLSWWTKLRAETLARATKRWRRPNR